MSNLTRRLSESHDVSAKVAQMLETRTRLALGRFNERAQKAREQAAELTMNPTSLSELWAGGARYGVDFAQRSILFWDTLRQRGNNFLEHERQGLPPVLRFDYETVMDGRSFKRPVNYALLRIVPPEGVTVDPKRRPFVIIDPRGGHGPGIGGFKDDSQVGVALHAGHPVYFVIFFPIPNRAKQCWTCAMPSASSCDSVRELHPDAPKPGIVGNCQAGWAAMMLAAADPDDTGPIVIIGAPMSYWGGAWSEGEGDNPMRYAGGLLGGTWLASLSADLGTGKFDGAQLVQNFENLNPANTLLEQVLPPVRQRRHRAAAFSRVRALVGRLLPDEPRRDRVDHAQSLRRQQAVVAARSRRHARGHSTCASIKVADHYVRLDGRQHHAAATGLQLGRRRLWQHRGDQGSRAGDRRPDARGRRAPRHLRLRQGGEEGRMRRSRRCWSRSRRCRPACMGCRSRSRRIAAANRHTR